MYQLNHSEYISKTPHKDIVLVLDEVSNTENIGLILRSAYFFGVSNVYIIGEFDNQKKKKIEKISRSALKYLKLHFKQDQKILTHLQTNQYDLVALEICDSSISIDNFKFNNKTALIIGNEKAGVSPQILDVCNKAVHIDGYTNLSSLNVAQATAIALYNIQE